MPKRTVQLLVSLTFALLVLIAAQPVYGQNDTIRCNAFRSWEDAQRYLNQHPQAENLDRDGDGLACEWMTTLTAARRSGLAKEYFINLDEAVSESRRANSLSDTSERDMKIIFVLSLLVIIGYLAFMTFGFSPNRSPQKPLPPRPASRSLVPSRPPITPRILELQAMDYKAYLKSPEWTAKRDRLRVLRGERCERCGSSDRLEVHHPKYRDSWGSILGRERDDQLELLCHDCHRSAHGLLGRPVPYIESETLTSQEAKVTTHQFPSGQL